MDRHNTTSSSLPPIPASILIPNMLTSSELRVDQDEENSLPLLTTANDDETLSQNNDSIQQEHEQAAVAAAAVSIEDADNYGSMTEVVTYMSSLSSSSRDNTRMTSTNTTTTNQCRCRCRSCKQKGCSPTATTKPDTITPVSSSHRYQTNNKYHHQKKKYNNHRPYYNNNKPSNVKIDGR